MWALRHPASGYVQGINDLVTPFYAVFLQSFADLDSTTVDADEETLLGIEADVYWCLTRLLDGIQVGLSWTHWCCGAPLTNCACTDPQDHYTPSQPGIQKMVYRLRELVFRIDGAFDDFM